MEKDIKENLTQCPPTPKNICAIIVTYHPDPDFLGRLQRIVGQVDKVVIVDNNSSEDSLSMLKEVSDNYGIHLIVNNENLGIATALNQGVRYAIEGGYMWVLTLDQDTVPHLTMVNNLITAYNDCPFRDEIGVIGSNYEEKNTGRGALYGRNYDRKETWFEIDEVITSGSLLFIPVFDMIGPFRDEFFIDLVDFEYCLRLRMNGYKVIISSVIGMIQSHGNHVFKNFLTKNISIHDYPPLRYYYRMRNGLFLVREYFWKETMWAIRRIYTLSKRLIAVILLEDNKIPKLKHMCLGIYHALILKSGKLD